MTEITDNDIKRFQETILEHSNYDFSEYTINSLKRRLTKILENYDRDINKLLREIAGDEEKLEQVIKRITVSTTELFRDPVIWKRIMFKVLPRYNSLPGINIWHAGCSTGQEVYSMMIILDHLGLLERSNIIATDLNTDALKAAEKGEYRYRFNKTYLQHFNDVFSMGEAENREYFSDWKKYMTVDQASDRIKMNEFLRKKPVFRKFDLVRERNTLDTRFDIIVCRNVIIYFNYELQNRVLKFFQGMLNNKGCLILGMHESIIGPCADLFTKEENIYFKHTKRQ